jgi:hypothetical protein
MAMCMPSPWSIIVWWTLRRIASLSHIWASFGISSLTR